MITIASGIAFATVVAGVALVSSPARDGRQPWAPDVRHWSLSPGRESVVYLHDRGATLRRFEREHHVGLGGCMTAVDFSGGVVALADGWRALVYNYRVDGGNWIESGQVENVVACLIDFRDGSTQPIGASVLDDPRHFSAQVGAQTGWLYVRGGDSSLQVFDLERDRSVDLSETGLLETQTAITELDGRVRIVSAELEKVDPQHPIYRGRLVVREFDVTTWPPALLTTRIIDVGGRPDQIKISPDGRWLAYDGSPYYVGIDRGGTVSDLGLTDLTTGAVVFEVLARRGIHRAHDVVTAGGEPFVLISSEAANYTTGEPVDVQWLGRAGKPAGRVAKEPGARLIWLPTFDRVLGGDYGTLDLLDLPPGRP